MRPGRKKFIEEAMRLMSTLRVLGFGKNGVSINGGDVVEAIEEQWPFLEDAFNKMEL